MGANLQHLPQTLSLPFIKVYGFRADARHIRKHFSSGMSSSTALMLVKQKAEDLFQSASTEGTSGYQRDSRRTASSSRISSSGEVFDVTLRRFYKFHSLYPSPSQSYLELVLFKLVPLPIGSEESSFLVRSVPFQYCVAICVHATNLMSSYSDLLTEELKCSICLEVFTDPVSTSCGHNFCKTCLNKCWDDSQTCRCPYCKETFNQRPDLRVNTALREIADHHKKTCPETKTEGPSDVREKELKCMQQYAVDVTLDPDTAHPELVLSEDGKQVRHGDVWQKLPNSSNRFDRYLFVLGKKGFSTGRFYFEVEVKGKTSWDVGVAQGSMNRKGEILPSPTNRWWTLILRNGSRYINCVNPPVSISVRAKPQRVGVFVDYSQGLVSFYDAESSSHIYSYTDQCFFGKLYPYISPCLNDRGKNSIPLIITPVHYNT
ncbi:ret finger protein-like 3 [Puntigrus tetrazona]|uniref:ret finger protein-like 3 n=1 Tax=Puntigrus tetrazona TaxID=1606681 RepID=UPI001C89A281|nr:ret finger protein-like 3 [Puntigrus tetrazona]